jgi:hypothetical protein
MRITRLTTGLMLALFCISSHAQSPEQKMTLTGKLSRVMAIGENQLAGRFNWSPPLPSAVSRSIL